MNERLEQVDVDGVATAVELNAEARRFELKAGEHTAVLTYRLDGRVLSLVHTEVPTELRGKRLGDALAHAALEYARGRDLTIDPACPFIEQYIARHPEYAPLVS